MPIDAFRVTCNAKPANPTVFFASNPNHPSLDFKRVSQRRPVYSVRVSIDYRALGVLEGGDIVWFWIGPHHDYDRLLRRI